MSVAFAEVERQARQLSTDERARLAELLLETLPEAQWTEFADEWQREIAERVAVYERGEAESHAAEDVFAEARRLAQ
jgi:putative addiction module component (TIGR02574 family)